MLLMRDARQTDRGEVELSLLYYKGQFAPYIVQIRRRVGANSALEWQHYTCEGAVATYQDLLRKLIYYPGTPQSWERP